MGVCAAFNKVVSLTNCHQLGNWSVSFVGQDGILQRVGNPRRFASIADRCAGFQQFPTRPIASDTATASRKCCTRVIPLHLRAPLLFSPFHSAWERGASRGCFSRLHDLHSLTNSRYTARPRTALQEVKLKKRATRPSAAGPNDGTTYSAVC